jgi:alpha-L-arabinofuranosidase
MVINKNMDNDISALIKLKDFVPSGKADAWVLNGLSIDANNEKISDNVNVAHKSFKIENASFEFTFEKHSLTAIEIRKIK